MTLVIIINGIDLSVGSIVGLAAITVTLLMQSGVNVWAAILITLFLTGVSGRALEWFVDRALQYSALHHYAGHDDDCPRRGAHAFRRRFGARDRSTFGEIGGGFFSVTVSTIVVLVILGYLLFLAISRFKQKQQYGVRSNGRN
jgi:D-xylose transport system permease protein